MLLVALRGVSPAPDDQWVTRLAALDAVRAEAFTTADPDLLGEVYTPRSAARRADAAAIGDYAARGGRVVGAGLRVLAGRVVEQSERRVRLDVVDQLPPARVEWADGSVTVLPRDRPTRRSITLVLAGGDGDWRIARVRDVPPES